MSTIFPSHQNSNNERTERRQNWKTEMRRSIEAKKPELSLEAATAKFDRLAAAMVANGSVEESNGCYKVRVGGGKKFYPVYQIKGVLRCACSEDERYGICTHVKAAEIFKARADREAEKQAKLETARAALADVLQFPVKQELPFTATLNYGNRKGLDFEKSERFATEKLAIEWLKREAFDKFLPEGEVTNEFGRAVFIICDEYFEQQAAEAA